MRPLKEIFDPIVEYLASSTEIGDYCPKESSIYFEQDGWLVEGRYSAIGDFVSDGDGWNLPYTITCTNADIEVKKISAVWSDDDYENEVPADQSVLDELMSYIEKNLPMRLENRCV